MPVKRNTSLAIRFIPGIAFVLAVIAFCHNLQAFFPNSHQRVGDDYGAYIPWMVSAQFWQRTNGFFSIPEFVPSFCAGVPLAFNPQSVFFSVPQLLLRVFRPVDDLFVSGVAFGLAGSAGTYFLLLRAFRLSHPACVVGATLFLLNGFYGARMMAGHLTFHGFALVPAIALCLIPTPLAQVGWRQLAERSVTAGLLMAYIFYSGGVYVLITVPLMLILLVLLHASIWGWHRAEVPVALLAVMITAGISAYRLLPAMFYLAHVPREGALIMVMSLSHVAAALFAGMFVPDLFRIVKLWDVNVGLHELDYSVGVAPLLLLGAGMVAAVRRRSLGHSFAATRTRLIGFALLVLLLPVPALICFDGFGMRWLLTQLPVIRSTSITMRFFSVYIPFVCVVSAILVDFVARSPQGRAFCCAGAVAITLGQFLITDRSYYDRQTYDPAPMEAALHRVRVTGSVPTIDRITAPAAGEKNFNWNEDFLSGGSELPCYEPMFGYYGEHFPRGHVHLGPALAQSSGLLNLKNPVCYVFSEANGCSPGDEFTVAQRRAAEEFASYRTFPYRWPIWEYLAAWVSVGTMIVCCGVIAQAVFGPVVRRLRRPGAHQV